MHTKNDSLYSEIRIKNVFHFCHDRVGKYKFLISDLKMLTKNILVVFWAGSKNIFFRIPKRILKHFLRYVKTFPTAYGTLMCEKNYPQ